MARKKTYSSKDLSRLSEAELVEGCVRNDRFHQEALYKRYFTTMMYMCMRYTRDQDEAMMIVNNGFLRVFKKLHTFSFKGSLEGWVRRLVFHSISDYFKKHGKAVHFLVFEERDEPMDNPALSNLYLEDILLMVDQLPPATAQVFRLYAIEGYTHVEIGEKLGISDGTSKWHLAAARKRLKELIQKNNYQQYAG
ncbi:MAG: RNA polymerase sigma factor [Phaeodactylibacter sp.]|nr:RNA polymerase sigma factor [Phaeodactylibacter sp.]